LRFCQFLECQAPPHKPKAPRGTEQILACVSRYDQSAWTANYGQSSKWCTYCKHRCATVLTLIQGCHIKIWNGKLMMHQKVS